MTSPAPSPRKVRAAIVVAALVAMISFTGAIPLVNEWRENAGRVPDLGGDDAVSAALEWLARHQQPDGRWSANLAPVCSSCVDGGRNESDVRVTALALVAIMSAGYTPKYRVAHVDPVTGRDIQIGVAVRNGFAFLARAQAPDGSFPSFDESVADTALATLAFSEAHGLTDAIAYRRAAEPGIAWIASARIPRGAWGTFPSRGPTDLRATCYSVMVWKSASISGIPATIVPDEVLGGVDHDRVQESGSDLERAVQRYVSRLVFSRFSGERVRPHALLARPPHWNRRTNDPTYWWLGTLAVFHSDETSFERDWEPHLRRTLLRHQGGRESGCGMGSWPAAPDLGETSCCGRVAATALGALSLQIRIRHRSVFGGR